MDPTQAVQHSADGWLLTVEETELLIGGCHRLPVRRLARPGDRSAQAGTHGKLQPLRLGRESRETRGRAALPPPRSAAQRDEPEQARSRACHLPAPRPRRTAGRAPAGGGEGARLRELRRGARGGGWGGAVPAEAAVPVPVQEPRTWGVAGCWAPC